jgi:hypothetical protein
MPQTLLSPKLTAPLITIVPINHAMRKGDETPPRRPAPSHPNHHLLRERPDRYTSI